MKKYYKIVILILLLLISPRGVEAATTKLFNASNTTALCSAVSSRKVKVGIHSFYSGADTILENTSGTCNNSAYYTNNLSEKEAGEDYPAWTYFTRSSASAQYFVEDVETTDKDEYRYFFIENRFQSYSTSTNKLQQTYTLKAGEEIFIDIDLENKFNINDYNDLRVSLNYGLTSSDTSIIRFNSITYYLIDENNSKYGPYKLGDVEFIKKFVYKSSSTTQTVSIYKLVSENLKSSSIPANTKIQKVRIVPYENRPVQNGIFRIFTLSLNGYSGSYSDGNNYISVSDAATKTRQNITNNMATNGTLKWGVNPARSLKYYCGLCGGNPKTFDSDHVYYGLPYVNNINATYYSFLSHTTKQDGISKYNFATQYVTKEISSRGNEMEGETTNPLYVYDTGSAEGNETRMQNLAANDYVQNKASDYFPGQDCSSSVFYADGKELPYVDTLAGSNFHLTSYHVRILGGLESNYSEVEAMLRNNNLVANNEKLTDAILRQYHTAYIKNKYTDQEVYNAYGLMQPGDSLVKDGHVRMETGYTHVECNDGTTTDNYTSNYCAAHGGINGQKSFVVVSEVRGTHVNLSTNTSELSVHLTQAEAGWTMTPDSNFTDVTNIDSLYESGNTKIASFRFNKKYLFSTLYGVNDASTTFDPETGIELEEEAAFMYLPYRYKEMDKIVSTNKVEKPKVKFIVEQDYESNMLNAKLYSYLKNNHKLRGEIISNYIIDKIKIKINSNSYYIYPNQTNYYSLNTDLQSAEVLNALNNLNYSNQNTISISVYTGPNLTEVKSNLNLDAEGFMKVVTITTPESKVPSTIEIKEEISIGEGEEETTINYNYDGDGEITCESADSTIVTCTVDRETKTIKLTAHGVGTTAITLTASEGEIFGAKSITTTVKVGNTATNSDDDTITVQVGDTSLQASRRSIIIGIILILVGSGIVFYKMMPKKKNNMD